MRLKAISIILTIYGLNLSHSMAMGGGGGRNTSLKISKTQSSFRACRDKNIYLSTSGNHIGFCEQGTSSSFEALSKILDVGTVLNFQKKIKDLAHTKIEFKIFETEMLEACATNNNKWFEGKKIDFQNQQKICAVQISQIRSSIKVRMPEMRIHLALSSSELRNESFINDNSTWMKSKISHGHFSDFSKLMPLSVTEVKQAQLIFSRDMSAQILSAEVKKKGAIKFSSMGSSLKNIDDIILEGNKNSPEKTKEDILADFINNKDKVYNIRQTSSIKEAIHKSHQDEYFKIMNQMPIMGYIDEVNIADPESPSNLQIANALKKTNEKLKKYLIKLKTNDLNSKDIKWGEYAQFTPEIEKILENNPEYCGVAETLLKVKSNEERVDLYEDLAIAAVAAVPCFFGGPITGAACIGGGLGVGAKGIVNALSLKENSESRNLLDFLGEEGVADFQALNKNEREVIMQSVLLPFGSFSKTANTGRVGVKSILKSYRAYDDVGGFLTKSEGLDLANSAMAKLVSLKNFDQLTAAERAIEFDKILAGQVLPKHLLSFLENKKGGFKLIDTNYDFDNFPPQILEALTKKLGSKEAALSFVKETYHRHVLDHHGSLGNMQNATQQVLSTFAKEAEQLTLLSSNPVKRKIAQEASLRSMKKEFYKVSTDNLGDGQLATYLVKNHSKQMITDPKFVKFMNRVANIEDFEAFGPGIYNKFIDLQAKASRGIKLSADEILEFDAINVAMARQKAINDTLLKYGTDPSVGDARKALLFADRFNGLPLEVQKKMVAEVDELTKKILDNKSLREEMAFSYVAKIKGLGVVVKQTEVFAKKAYEGLAPEALQVAKEEVFAFNATIFRNLYEKSHAGKPLGPFEVFHSPQMILGGNKKVLVSISDIGEKRTFVVAFGNGLRKGDDSLKLIAKEIHLVEKRTLEKLIQETSDAAKIKIYKQELDGLNSALSGPNMDKFGGPASMMRSAAEDTKIKDLVFNFNGIRSSEADILEAVVRGRAKQAQSVTTELNKNVRRDLFNQR